MHPSRRKGILTMGDYSRRLRDQYRPVWGEGWPFPVEERHHRRSGIQELGPGMGEVPEGERP